MKIDVRVGSIQDLDSDALILGIMVDTTSLVGVMEAIDKALHGAIREMIDSKDITGKIGEVTVLYPREMIPARRILITGLGKNDELNLDAIRIASSAAAKKATDLGVKQITTVIHGAGVHEIDLSSAAQATLEGLLLTAYQYKAAKQTVEPLKGIDSITIFEQDESKQPEIAEAIRIAEAVAQGVYLARDLVNGPPNEITPSRLAEVAQGIAEDFHLKIFIGDRDWAAQQNMGAFLGVAKGTKEPPKFIVLEHNLERTDLDTIVIVGKGITFDSGGISLKPSENMGEMKSDMAGAAAVLATMKVIGLLNLPLRIIGITPCTDNMPGGDALHPGDVLTASNGKTIEIVSTDAEGRLILSDALVYAESYHPHAVIDLATLTGACVIALGEGIAAGIFCSDETLADKLILSGTTTHERLWRLPLWDDYKKVIKSDVADIKNSGGRYSGVGSSAIFIKEFTSYPWAHLDIAGMAFTEKSDGYIPAGGTGFGVRLLVDFLQNWKR